MLRLAYFDRDQDSVVMDIGSVLDLKTPWAGKHARWVGQRGLVAARRLACHQTLDMVPDAQGVGVITSKDPLLVGQQLLQQPQGLRRMPALLHPEGDVVPGE